MPETELDILRYIDANTSGASGKLDEIAKLLSEILKELQSQHETLIQIVQNQ
nr:hypothetical protein [uncultured Roseococcus sp.]